MSIRVHEKSLTSKKAARLLGVSEASVKRWADTGLLPAKKTPGGHRRFKPEDIANFQSEGFDGNNGSVREPTISVMTEPSRPEIGLLEPGNASTLIDETFDILVDGNVEGFSNLLVNLYLHGQSFEQTADHLLCPVMRKIGNCWQSGTLSVAQEHVASRAALEGLRRFRAATAASSKSKTGLKMLCASTENDFHEFPVEFAALTLECKGWTVINIGTNTPFHAVDEAVKRFKPQLVCIASTILNDLDRAVREFKELRKATRRSKTRIVLGGMGFSGKIKNRFEADLYADSFRQLAEYGAEFTD